MAHLCDSGALEALTPDDSGILREWSSKYAVITDPRTSHASVSIYSSPDDSDSPEVVIPLNGSEVQISKQPEFERCFTVTTAEGLRIFLRAGSISERDSWVESLKQAKGLQPKTKQLPTDSKGRATSAHKRSQLAKAIDEGELRYRACGHVFLWDEGGQKWLSRYFYVSPGIINEFNRDFQGPLATYDLTRDCAIRMRGSPPCVELKLGTGELLRFFGKTDNETREWLASIKARATEPPQPFVDFARAGVDASRFENDGGALSFYVKPDVIGDLMAGVPSSFSIMGAIGDPVKLQGAFSAFLSGSDSDASTVKVKGTFHILSDNSLSLRLVHHQQGRYPLHVQFQGNEVFGSPFTLVIHPGPPSPQHSLVTGQGLFHAPLPDSSTVGKFTIRLRDRYLNFCERIDPTQLKVLIFGPATILHMIYLGEGATDVTYQTISCNEEIQIEISYANIPVAGSPFVPSFEPPSYVSHEPSFSNAMMMEGGETNGQDSLVSHRGPMDEEQRAMQESVQMELDAAETAKQVANKAEAVSAFVSSRIRQDWAESNRQVDQVFPREEQLEILLASSALRANGSDDEPAFLRKLAVAVETDRGQMRKWEAEPLPPPWASMSVVQAYVRRQRRDLQDAIQPLIDATKTEQAEGRRLEPVANWKKLLLDWPGPDKVPTETLEAFKTAISVSPFNHRQLIVAMCDAVLRAEEDLARRRALLLSKGGGILIEGEADSAEEKEQEEAAGRQKGKLSALNHREQLRRRVQSVALGRNLHRPGEPLLLASEKKRTPKESKVDRVERQNREEEDEDDEDEDEADQDAYTGEDESEEKETKLRHHGSSASSVEHFSSSMMMNNNGEVANGGDLHFEVGDRVKVDGLRVGTVRHFGPTRFASGTWVGIELDEAEGKNAGSVAGVQYFACAPRHGLFVRPERVVIVHQQRRSNTSAEYSGEEPEEEAAGETVKLAPGSLAHIDARELIAAFRARRDDQGSLTSDLFVEAFQEMDPRISLRDARKLFAAFDRDSSGSLDAREFIPGALVLCGGEGESKMRLSFQLLDFDQSGYLEREEVENYVVAVFRIVQHAYPDVFESNGISVEALAEESVNSALESADQDKDGRISLEEFRKWMVSMAIPKETTATRHPQQQQHEQQQRATVAPRSNQRNAADSRQHPPSIPPSRATQTSNNGMNNRVQTPLKKEPEDDGNAVDAQNKAWNEVQRWLVDEALVVLPFEQKASFAQFKEHHLTSLVRVARLTATDINRLNLSFDLRLRLITAVRALARSLVFEASERKIRLSPLAGPHHQG